MTNREVAFPTRPLKRNFPKAFAEPAFNEGVVNAGLVQPLPD